MYMEPHDKKVLNMDKIKGLAMDLIRNPHIKDDNYKSAYIEGVLDLFNCMKELLDKED